MSERCCCGKYSDVDSDGFIHNKTQHMPINTGSFCGPIDRHTIAALEAKIGELEAAKDSMKDVIRKVLPGYRPGNYYEGLLRDKMQRIAEH